MRFNPSRQTRSSTRTNTNLASVEDDSKRKICLQFCVISSRLSGLREGARGRYTDAFSENGMVIEDQDRNDVGKPTPVDAKKWLGSSKYALWVGKSKMYGRRR